VADLTHTLVAISLRAFYAAFWYLVIQYMAGRSTAHKIRLQIQCHSASMPMVALSSECWPSQKVKRSALIKENYSSSAHAHLLAVHGLPPGFRKGRKGCVRPGGCRSTLHKKLRNLGRADVSRARAKFANAR
jgi:hypothetical protein